MPDMPVASTSCFGRSMTLSPVALDDDRHSFAASSYRARLHSVEPQ